MFRRLQNSRRAPKASAPIYRHPILGELRYVDGSWDGRAGAIEISVEGTVDSPDASACEAASRRVARLDELRAQIDAWLGETLPKGISPSDFTLTGLTFDTDCPTDFMIWLELLSDRDGLWRIEMVNGAPRELGRDS